jgi:hypothetical protein
MKKLIGIAIVFAVALLVGFGPAAIAKSPDLMTSPAAQSSSPAGTFQVADLRGCQGVCTRLHNDCKRNREQGCSTQLQRCWNACRRNQRD